jgi:hypothetical protein
MKRTIPLLLLIGVLMGTLSLAAPASAAASSTWRYFETNLGGPGGIWVEGWIHFTVVSPGSDRFLFSDPYRIYATLVNVRAEDWTTHSTYVGGGTAAFDGFVGVSSDAFSFYRFVATRLLPPNPVKVLDLGFLFDDLLVNADGSVTYKSVTIQNVVTPDG